MSARCSPARSTIRAGSKPRIAASTPRTRLDHHALVEVVELPGGFRLLVGRDLEERERMFDIIANAGRWSFALVVVLGLAGGFFVSRRVLNRIDAMTGTAQTIMAGDLTGRLPIAGTGDELDRLAVHLNAMLERIEALMHGFKEVSDNIAHDLKTPLTRLRNRCEEALRTAKDDAGYRAALETTIAESDDLIRTFNALLMIARAESGQARDNMVEFDAAEIARGVGELYEPLAEEKGLALKIDAPAAAPVRGNPELVSQALANLVDNAIKYAGPKGFDGNSDKLNGARGGDRGRRRQQRRAHHAHRGGSRSGHRAGRSRPRGRTFRAARAEPLRARLGLGAEPRLRRGAASRRRTEARGQSSRAQKRHRAAARRPGGGVMPPAPPGMRSNRKPRRRGPDPTVRRRFAVAGAARPGALVGLACGNSAKRRRRDADGADRGISVAGERARRHRRRRAVSVGPRPRRSGARRSYPVPRSARDAGRASSAPRATPRRRRAGRAS